MQSEITKQAGALGANFIITPKNWCAYDQISILTGEALPESLQHDVFDKVAAIDGITAVPLLTQKTAIRNNPVLVTGIMPEEMKGFKSWEVAEGAYFVLQDERSVVVGSGIADSFGLRPGDELTIRGEAFPVIAVLEPTGNNDDASIYLPLAVVQEIYEVGEYISYIAAKVADITRMDAYVAAILDVANVSVTSDRQLLSSVLSILGSVTVTLQLIAGIALIAAAFGIINTMMTAVYERRREIGILRSIGSKSSDIFKLFIMESGIYGLLGGIVGVVSGFIVSIYAGPLITQNDMNPLLKGLSPEASVDASLAFSAILFSLGISALAGLYPALKAAKLTPVEAIHDLGNISVLRGFRSREVRTSMAATGPEPALAENKSIIKTENLEKIYSNSKVKTHALKGVNIEIPGGSFSCIIGPSGHGKTTLLHLIGGLDKPSEGRVFVDGMDTSSLKDKELSELRAKKIGFVFQFFNLLQNLSALENIQAAMMFGNTPPKEQRAKAEELLELVGLSDKANAKPSELSGGQQQRVSIARALANDPEILLMDEPTGNLDTESGEDVLNHIFKIHKAGKTIVVVTHNDELAKKAEVVLEIRDGRVK